jgi:uncharacterized protein DUF1707/cell wall-active antibiotic response 4TMS protein YvqF
VAADQPDLRVSDDDRERAVARLRDASAEGRLTLEELADRVGDAYSAQTAGELAKLTDDLPAAPARPAGGKARRWIIDIMGGTDLRGRWRPAEKVNAVAFMGGGDIDLRDALIESDTITITAVAVMGGIDVIVPDGVEVDATGFAFMGGRSVRAGRKPPPPGAPRVRVRAFALMGGVDVKTKERR